MISGDETKHPDSDGDPDKDPRQSKPKKEKIIRKKLKQKNKIINKKIKD